MSDPAPAVQRLEAGGSIKAEVEQLVQPLMDRGEIYSTAIGVRKPDGSSQVFGYGPTGREGETRSPRGDDIFQVGSISKLFVAAVLDQLVKEGKIRYEDTVRSILPPEARLSESVGKVTVKELATHTSGLPRQPTHFTQLRYITSYVFTGQNPYGYMDKASLYRHLRLHKISPKENREPVYSNVGFALLAHMIEIKTGKSFPDLVKTRVTGPLRMKDTVYFRDAEQQKRQVVGHVGDQPIFIARNTPMPTWDMGKTMRPTGAIYSSVNDLLILAKSSLAELRRSSKSRLPARAIDLGWEVRDFDEHSVRIVYSHGMVSGYSAYIGLNVERQIAVVVLLSNFNWDEKIGSNLVLRLSKGLTSPRRRRSVP